MEEIIQFPFEIRGYVCDVREKKVGAPKFRKLEELLALPRTVNSYGTSEGRIVNTDLRNSTFIESIFEFFIQPEIVIEEFKKLVPENKKNYVDWKTKQKYEVVVYEPGGFFAEHTDRIRSKTHFATLLIFPPAVGTLSHVGGDLLITKEKGEKFTFESSKNLQWTILAFHPRLRHEILPITSGNRVVLKTELCYLRSAIPTPGEVEDIPRWDVRIVD